MEDASQRGNYASGVRTSLTNKIGNFTKEELSIRKLEEIPTKWKMIRKKNHYM
jgi:hypothetical protein